MSVSLRPTAPRDDNGKRLTSATREDAGHPLSEGRLERLAEVIE
jgi:hypothetical protein